MRIDAVVQLRWQAFDLALCLLDLPALKTVFADLGKRYAVVVAARPPIEMLQVSVGVDARQIPRLRPPFVLWNVRNPDAFLMQLVDDEIHCIRQLKLRVHLEWNDDPVFPQLVRFIAVAGVSDVRDFEVAQSIADQTHAWRT